MKRPQAYAVQVLVSSVDDPEIYETMVDAVVDQIRQMLLEVYSLVVQDDHDPIVLAQDLRNYDPKTGKFLPPEESEWRYE